MAAPDEKPGQRRENTDQSLRDERTKTDKHLEHRHQEVEGETTAALEEGRRVADEQRARERATHDRQVWEGRQGTTTEDETQVKAEREQSDTAMVKERALQDVTLQRERRDKQLVVEALLSRERHRTDTNLKDEREGVDDVCRLALHDLAEEQGRYARLREELSDRDLGLGIICHDLKNQSGAISIGAQLLRKQLSKDAWDRANVMRQVTAIEENAAFLGRMIDSLLDMERFTHGKVALHLKRTDLCEFLQNAAKLFTSVATNRSCSLLTKLGVGPLWVTVDQDRLLQALSNLVGNAIKFTPAGGTITLTAEQDETRATVSVTDTGPGIAEQDVPKLFKKFSQLHKPEGGLGLGLYIAKSIVESHGGTMWVDSILGHGSSFRFTLPLASRHSSWVMVGQGI